MKYTSLVEVAAAKQRLRADRDRLGEGLKSQLELIRERDFRRRVVSDAVGDMIEAWGPIRALRNAFTGSGGVARTAMGLAMGAKAKTPMGRFISIVVSFALPALLERMGKNPNVGMDTVEEELKTSCDRIKQYVEERRAAHTGSTND